MVLATGALSGMSAASAGASNASRLSPKPANAHFWGRLQWFIVWMLPGEHCGGSFPSSADLPNFEQWMIPGAHRKTAAKADRYRELYSVQRIIASHSQLQQGPVRDGGHLISCAPFSSLAPPRSSQ